jgi:hypothetical protein
MKINFKNVIGKHILVGITGYDEKGNKIYSFELHGTVIYAKKGDRISIKVESDPVPSEIILNEDSIYSIPPDVSGMDLAPEGIYTLKSTGEKFVDPDLLASWSVNMREDNKARSYEPF